MAKIKLNDKFAAEVEEFRSSAVALDSSSFTSINVGNLSLPTVDAYQDRLYKIRKLLIRFELLIKKDAKDMDELAAMLKAADGSSN